VQRLAVLLGGVQSCGVPLLLLVLRPVALVVGSLAPGGAVVEAGAVPCGSADGAAVEGVAAVAAAAAAALLPLAIVWV